MTNALQQPPPDSPPVIEATITHYYPAPRREPSNERWIWVAVGVWLFCAFLLLVAVALVAL